MEVAPPKVGVRHQNAALRVAAPLRYYGSRYFIPGAVDAGRPRRPGSYLASCAGCQMETVGNQSDRVLRCELCETGCDNKLKEAMLAGPCAADEQPRNSYGALICEKYTETEDFDADAATAYASKMRVQQLREELYLLGVSTRNMLYWDQLVDAYVGALRAGTPRRYGPRRQRHCHCYPSS